MPIKTKAFKRGWNFKVLIIFTSVFILGLITIPELSIHLEPKRYTQEITINYNWPDASAKIIEKEVTSKLEGRIAEIAGIASLTSISNKNYGSIVVTFKNNRDILEKRYAISSAVRQVQPSLPSEVSYPKISIGSQSQATKALLVYSINSEESSEAIENSINERIIKSFNNTSDIAMIDFFGDSSMDWKIGLDEGKMRRFNITPNKVQEQISNFFSTSTVGYLRSQTSNDENIAIRISANKELNSSVLEGLSLKSDDHSIFYLRDIAKVKLQDTEKTKYFRVNGKKTINVAFYPTDNSNLLELSKTIKEKMDFISKNSKKYKFQIIEDKASYLKQELFKITKRSIYTILILISLIFIIYRNYRYVIIIILGISCNLSIAVIFYKIFDVQIQLYSLAGITISLGLIIDNIILTLDYLRHNIKKSFIRPILAATLTTIGAVSIIFFLDKEQSLNLMDFGYVVIINLSTSIVISYFLIPALFEKIDLLPLDKKSVNVIPKIIFDKYQKFLLLLTNKYLRLIVVIALLLLVGIPFSLFPDKIDSSNESINVFYNKTMNDKDFRRNTLPSLEYYFGGSINRFIIKINSTIQNNKISRERLIVTASLPNYSQIENLNRAILKLENYLTKIEGIDYFTTNIENSQVGFITVFFKNTKDRKPLAIKHKIENIVPSLGGLDWAVTGIGKGFSNAINDNYYDYNLILEGYNFDLLNKFAGNIQNDLISSSNSRIEKVQISSDEQINKPLFEYSINLENKSISSYNLLSSNVENKIQSDTREQEIFISSSNLKKKIIVRNSTTDRKDMWSLMNEPFYLENQPFKIKYFGELAKSKTGNKIIKRNQKFRLVLGFDYRGTYPVARKYINDYLKLKNQKLPIGFELSWRTTSWNSNNPNQYYLIFLVIAIIFVICAILFESLIQPLAIILIIPVSLIGTFLAFNLINVKFDQGGYASIIMVSGLAVNSAIYIINEFNSLKKSLNLKDSLNLELFSSSIKNKILPILITITTTIAGLLPFIVDSKNTVFWYSFAIGTIGGLIFSIIAILIFLPIFLVKR